MPDDTTAALQALIKQVETLTNTVTDQQKRMDGLHDFNTRILDEKKDMQRQLEQQTETDKKLADMGYQRAQDGNYYPQGTKPAHTLTRAEARDPQKYRAAKESAAKAGATLQIVDSTDGGDTHRRSSRTETDTSLTTTLIRDDDQKVAYMRRDVMGSDARQYRQLRADGFNVQSWDNADDLPQHMQTKLALMEKSNDA